MNKSIVLKYWKDYRFNSVFIKNFIIIGITVLLPLSVIIIGAFFYYNKSLQAEILTTNTILISKTQNSFDKVFSQAYDLIEYIKQNENIKLYMYEDSIYDSEKYYSYSALNEFIKMQTLAHSNIENIYVYAQRSDSVLSKYGIWPLESFFDQVYVRKCFDDLKTERDIQIYIDNEKQKIALQAPIYLGRKYMGVISIDIKLSYLRSIVEDDKRKVYVIFKDKIIYSNNETLLGRMTNSLSDLAKYLNNTGNVNIVDKSNTIILSTSETTQYRYVILSDISQHSERIRGLLVFLIISIIGLTIITFIICFIISVKIFKPYHEMVKTLQSSSNSHENYYNNEIGYILNTILQTKLDNEEIEKELERRIILLKKAQSIALQAQINPHFFHNTLETINILAMNLTGCENKASKAIKMLSQITRLALENTDSIISIGKEVEHCKAYLEIQNLRYENKISVLWDIPVYIYKYGIIRIALQPIVENAIYHGIKPSPTNCELRITALECSEGIEIKISNTGIPLSEERLNLINETIQSEVIKESSHIGLSNVNQRIKLFWGDQYGLSIDSNHENTTSVTIKIPSVIL